MQNNEQLPEGLPVPLDDGACDHLKGRTLPHVTLESTDGAMVDLSQLRGTTVLYLYPMSGPDNTGLPPNWDAIPGARGCTPQACSFRDHYRELSALGAAVYGVSTQTVNYQKSEVRRIHLPFPLLSDSELLLAGALSLPTFDVQVAGTTVLKRVTLICMDAKIVHVFYPVFPPDKNGAQVVSWLKGDNAQLEIA